MPLGVSSENKSSKGLVPFQLFIGMAFSINLLYIIDLIGHFKFSIGSYWSVGLLLSLILFAVVWFTEKKMVARATIGYLLINLVILALDLISFYLFNSNYFPGLLGKIFSPTLADFGVKLLSSLK